MPVCFVEIARPTRMAFLTQGVLAFCFVLGLAPSTSYAQGVTATPYDVFQTVKDPVFLTFSDDGQLLLAGDKKGHVICWNVEQKVEVWRTELDGEILFLGFLSENQSFIAVEQSGHASIRSIRDGTLEGSLETQARPRQVALDGRRRSLAVATKDDAIERKHAGVFR